MKSNIEERNAAFFGTAQQLRYYSETKTTLVYPEKQLFDAHITNKMKVLDIGCGEGRTTEYISKISKTVIGMDIVQGMVELAKKRHPAIDFRVMDACKLEFPDASFDCVVFSYNGLDCLYPESSRAKAISEIYRVLKKGGIFIYSSHNRGILTKKAILGSTISFFVNLLGLRLLSSYRWDIHKEGILLLYATTPKREVHNLSQQGFALLKIASINPQKRYYPEKNAWTYYAFRKNERKEKDSTA